MTSTTHRNRMKGYFSAEAAPLPDNPDERASLWADYLLRAVMTLAEQLTNSNPQIAAAAANSILDLEKTRMRHNGQLAGTIGASFAPHSESRREAEAHEALVTETHEAMIENEKRFPDAGRPPATRETAERQVHAALAEGGLKASAVPPGTFRASILKAMAGNGESVQEPAAGGTRRDSRDPLQCTRSPVH